MKECVVAFVGNPNVGKSAWINLLANAQFKVGNWPGVTVEKKEAKIVYRGTCYHLIDLPGTYSFHEKRDEGRITAAYLKNQKVDLIINVCDSLHLRRSLRLTMQLRELQLPMIVVCSFYDVAIRKGIWIDCDRMQAIIGMDTCFMSAYQKKDRQALWDLIEKKRSSVPVYPPLFAQNWDEHVRMVNTHLKTVFPDERQRYAALYAYFRKEVTEGLSSVEKQWQERYEQEDVWSRYDEVVDQILHAVMKEKKHKSVYSWIDRILLHPLLAYPCCILFFYLFLQMVFQGSTPWSDFIRFLAQDYLIPYVRYWLQDCPQFFLDFFTEGILQTIATLLSFLPLIATLYFWIAFLEESGYYARIAFLCDRIMSYFHLSGKAFLAFILGAGCNVPGIIATKSMETQKQRMLTAVLVPFISCGARLPVYLLFCASFFRGKEAAVIFSLYGIGLLIAFLCAWILSKFPYFREDDIYMMELPSYRLPSIRVLGKKACKECINYMKKACSVVLLVTVALWCFSYFPNGEREDSFLAKTAQKATFAFAPLGFGDSWECVASLPGGIVAKESILTYLYPQEEKVMRAPDFVNDFFAIVQEGIQAGKQALFLQTKAKTATPLLTIWQDEKAPLKAYCFLVYVLLSIPCVMTLSTIRTLYGNHLLICSILLMSIFPYLVTFLIYQVFS